MKFDMPKDSPSIIKVVGVGGGGSNAVNHMFKQGIRGVDFMICNTDSQALDASPVTHKVQLGASLTEGRGAGSIPEVGMNAAIETIDQLKEELSKNTKMVFITAGMGGGTGTGAAPIIAEAARELGILTIGIVTMPFFFEGRKRKHQAEAGIQAIRESVDSLIIINNDRLREMYGNLRMSEAFAQADNVLTTAAKGIAELITRTGHVNVDFEDVRTVMNTSGVAIMGSAEAEGEDRAIKAIELALASPLLNDNDIKGARYVLLNMEFGDDELQMDEIAEITDYIQEEAGMEADVIWGYGCDETLGENVRVTVVATGFKTAPETGVEALRERPVRRVNRLTDDVNTELTKPIGSEEKKQQPEAPQQQEPFVKPSEPIMQSTIEFDLTADRAPKEQEPERKEEPKDFGEPFMRLKEEEPKQQLPAQPTQPIQPKQELPQQPKMDERAQEAAQSSTPVNNAEESQSLIRERMKRLSDISNRLRSPQGVTDLEKVPAYVRRQINLGDTPHSSESQVSRYTLGEEEGADGEKRGGLRSNNSFLHDNVD